MFDSLKKYDVKYAVVGDKIAIFTQRYISRRWDFRILTVTKISPTRLVITLDDGSKIRDGRMDGKYANIFICDDACKLLMHILTERYKAENAVMSFVDKLQNERYTEVRRMSTSNLKKLNQVFSSIFETKG